MCDNGELDGRLWITSIERVTRNLIDRVTTREVGRIQHATRKENGKEMLARFDVDEFSIS